MRADAARAITVAGLVAALAGCGGHASVRFPANPTRPATSDAFSTDAMRALGFRPLRAVAASAGVSASVDALAGEDPDAIVAPIALEQGGWNTQLQKIAPTVYYIPGSTWQSSFRSLATAVGRSARAGDVIERLARRADAIRKQIAGRTLAFVRIQSAHTFTTVNDDVPVALLYEHDLGLKNFHLKPQQYPLGCAAAPRPAKACTTNSLYAGIVSTLTADAMLVETGPGVAVFEHAPYFHGLPEVRVGHVAQGATLEELGPLGVAGDYSAIARAFGIVELHQRATDVTLNPATRRLCWAGPFTLGSLRISSRSGCTSAPVGVIRAVRAKLAPGPLPVG